MIKIRPLLSQDYPGVKNIYQEGIGTQNATFETKAPDWPTFRNKFMAPFCVIAEIDEQIAGWAGERRSLLVL